MIYATIDQSGIPTGFFSDAVHGWAIPEGAIEVTEDQWRECLAHQGERRFEIAEGVVSLVEYSPPPLTPEQQREAMPALSARQLRLGLVANGILPAQVEAAIAGIADPQEQAIAEIEWEYATQFVRTHPLIAQIGGVLELTPEQMDAMWLASVNV